MLVWRQRFVLTIDSTLATAPATGGVGQDYGYQPDGADAFDQGGGADHESRGTRTRCQYCFRGRAPADRFLRCLCGSEGRPDPPDALHGGGNGARDAVNCVAPGLLERTRATSNLRVEQIEQAASGSLLKKAADKDDCADMVVTMCRTETMTGQTIVIDSGRVFH